MIESLKLAANAAKIFLVKNSPSILTGLGVAGVAATAVLTANATLDATNALSELIQESEEAPTVKEQAKVVVPCYIPAATMGIVTMGCIIGANSVNIRRNAALAAAYLVSAEDFKEYKEKAEEKLGKKKSAEVKDELAEKHIAENPVEKNHIYNTGRGDTLCYDALSGRYFYSDMETIRKAQNNINEELISGKQACMSLNDFYYELGLEPIKLGEELGWNPTAYEGQMSISFSSQITEKGIPCLVMDYAVGPRFDF